ncbi:cobyrinate a,c-diamide synthase [Obesumbacterium proteus]|mgnify:CR=1 FL=1|uniref:cobyrinate a,c-diamide synthase n=1 Tax=Obesumbacterium proteus TaxID=82983 RepID=UPI00242BB810|nr:cobyrinate a,c-diamide synthase [Obesumbacterium proteus]
MKAFLIGGTGSGCGKTTLTLGLLRALTRRGLRVQPYKVGPDYIDTGWHSAVSGVASRNLDAFMLPQSTLNWLYNQHAQAADVAVIEGVMGLYDGYGTDPNYCSSAGIAKQIGCPVILVIDGKAVSTSAAATVMGFCHFDPAVRIAGVIVNRVNSETHYQLLKQAIETYTKIPVLGRIPTLPSVSLPERHLGLITAHEQQGMDALWDTLADSLEQHIDLDRLLALSDVKPAPNACAPALPAPESGRGLTLALADDEAFHFYYPDNLQLLEQLGINIVRFSPLRDAALPACQMVYIGGGYPELHGETLAKNSSMRQSLRDAHQRGVAIYAECGGLMYLGTTLKDQSGNTHAMTGIFPGESRMEGRLKRFGYCQATAMQDTLLAAKGETLRGHEFHYSDFHTDFPPVFQFEKQRDGVTQQRWQGGYQMGNTLASYLHLHFYQHPEMLSHWLKRGRAL